MNKKAMFTFKVLMAFALLLIGCSNAENESSYNGKSLNIAVLGNPPNTPIDNVNFEKVSIDDLREQNNGYDALFVMEDSFGEYFRPENSELFYKTAYPKFFVGLKGTKSGEVIPNAVFKEGLSFDEIQMNPESRILVKGYDLSGDMHTYWTYTMKENHNEEEMYIEILNKIGKR